MKNEEIVRKINPGLVQENGRMKPFAEQLLEYEYGVYPKNAPFVISNTTMRLNDAIILPHPITITQSAINKIKKKHDISNAFIMRIESMLRNNVLMMESRSHKESLVVITDCIDKEDNPIVLVLRRDSPVGYKMTNQITSMYGKKNMEYFLEATFREGCEFYPNEKTEHWLSSQRLQLPPDVASALSYHYNIPDTLYCQAENLYHRGNRSGGSKTEKFYPLEDQIAYANIRKSGRKGPVPSRAKREVKNNEKVR